MQKSLAEMRKRGYVCEITEHFNFYTKRKKDLFGMFDFVALHPDIPGMLGVQTTSRGNMNARIKKLQANPILALWCRAGLDAVVHGWSKKGLKGKRKLWTLDERPIVP